MSTRFNRLNKIIAFYRKHKRMPSYSEIMRIFSYRSKNSVTRLLARLIDGGYIAKDEKGKLLPTRYFCSYPVLGGVRAGFPSAAEEELVDVIGLDEFLVSNPEATFILKVQGDSMKDAGLIDGDLVLLERGRIPRPGDIVVAEVDGEWTIKYFRKSGSRCWLEPANRKYKPIIPREELRIAGVVIASVRKY